jgi:hypothetical protein
MLIQKLKSFKIQSQFCIHQTGFWRLKVQVFSGDVGYYHVSYTSTTAGPGGGGGVGALLYWRRLFLLI